MAQEAQMARKRLIICGFAILVVLGVAITSLAFFSQSGVLIEGLPGNIVGQGNIVGNGKVVIDAGGERILETGYGPLKGIGEEEPGYGLYSYAVMVNYNSRSAKFLSDVFSAIPPVENTAAQRSQTNIFYIPIRKDKLYEFQEVSNGNFFISHTKDFYNFTLARLLLDHLCDPPAQEIKAVCEGDLSRGPYIFTYAKPASKVTPVPPPFLFMDLSDVHERAFPEIIAAFRAQVKRDDISDRAKIDTLRLKLLSIVLTAADFVAPVQKATADIVHIASGRADGDKK
jgi:hypothetical protein